jgi:hypothetical protein
LYGQIGSEADHTDLCWTSAIIMIMNTRGCKNGDSIGFLNVRYVRMHIGQIYVYKAEGAKKRNKRKDEKIEEGKKIFNSRIMKQVSKSE